MGEVALDVTIGALGESRASELDAAHQILNFSLPSFPENIICKSTQISAY